MPPEKKPTPPDKRRRSKLMGFGRVPKRPAIGRGLERFSRVLTDWVGTSWAFGTALLVVVVWAATGPLFHFSDTWQLVINTGTTIVTFLIVFLIQNTQNRDTKAIHLKLDELLRGVAGARNSLVDLEHLSDEALDHLQQEFEAL